MSRKRGVKNNFPLTEDFLEGYVISSQDLPPPSKGLEINGRRSRSPRESLEFSRRDRSSTSKASRSRYSNGKNPGPEPLPSTSGYDPTPRTEVVPFSEFKELSRKVDRLRTIIEKLQDEVLSLGERMKVMEGSGVCEFPSDSLPHSPELVPPDSSESEGEKRE